VGKPGVRKVGKLAGRRADGKETAQSAPASRAPGTLPFPSLLPKEHALTTMDLAPVLFAVGTLAGLIDAMAGGGGLITVPALLWSGLDPVSALATNKAQGVFGSGAATANFARQGAIDLRQAWPAVACAFIGAGGGAAAVQHLGSDTLARIVPLLLIAFALYFLFSPRVSDLDSRQRLSEGAFALLVGTGVGFYDGFFGPGTGSFLVFVMVRFLRFDYVTGTGNAKCMNFGSNVASLAILVAKGLVVWPVAIPMAAANAAGSWCGSRMAIAKKARFIRWVFLAAAVAVAARMISTLVR
jgi:uncharacterized membrane protein YfcA